MIKWLKSLVYTYFHHIKLNKKLMISFSIIVLMPIILFYLLSYRKIADILEDNVLFSATQSYEQAYAFSSYKLYKMLRTSDIIVTDNRLHEVLALDIESTDIVTQVNWMYELQDYFSSFEDPQDIVEVRMYIPSDFIFANEGNNFLDLNNITYSIWYNKINQRNAHILFTPSMYLTDTMNDNLLSIIRPIKNLEDFSKIESYLRIDFQKEALLDIIQKSNPIKNSFTLIINSEGDLVLTSNEFLQNQYDLSPQDLINEKNISDRFILKDLGLETFFIQGRLIPNTDWTIMTLVPYSEILLVIKQQRQVLVFALAAMIILAFGLISLISYFITRRIHQLSSHMNSADASQKLPVSMTTDKDEIGTLALSYNLMLDEIESLLKQQYESGKQIKNAELKVIQAQINPHFLYNTLEMINWMAKKQETEHILNVTSQLSKFYKLSLNKGNDFISLKDEFAHLNAYIQIQNFRFENSIFVSQNLDPKVSHFIVPKIILQPIVENAITHGILEKDEPNGLLEINAWAEEYYVKISIKDDGVGIKPIKLHTLFDSSETSSKGSHYGLNNIKERLDLYYNQQATIEIRSTLNVGTTVLITLPLNDVKKKG